MKILEEYPFNMAFNVKRFNELMKNTPTNFMTPKGNVNARKEFVKSVVAACRLLNQELDRNHIYYGNEGSGKSHTVFQHTYIWWWCLNELGMIDYPFSMDLIYARLKDMMADMDKYKNNPYRIYSLDESDDLNRKNWQKPIVKDFLSKLRKERKNLRIVNLLMPALDEMLPAITLSRINWVIELQMDVDRDCNIVRGGYKLLNIPVGTGYNSPMQNRFVTQKEIKSYINERLYDKSKAFESLPNHLLAFRGRVNSTFVFDKEVYKQWARDKNAQSDEDNEKDDTRANQLMEQRDKLINWCLEQGSKQVEIAKVIGLSRTAIGSIKAMTTPN